MAGDWIKMRCDLRTDPAVLRIMRQTGYDEFEVIGRLHRFWSWVDAHCADGEMPHVTLADVDALVDARETRFAQALVDVDWLAELSTGKGGLCVPRYERHNGATAKKRVMKSSRQARWRDGKYVDAVVSTVASIREEKRRSKTPSPSPSPAGKGDGRKHSANGQTLPKLPQAWWSDPDKASAAGTMLGISATPGESLPAFAARIRTALEQRKQQQEASH